jgi:hypothetical protein
VNLPNCSNFGVVKKLKAANRIAFKQLQNLRVFMDNNQQVSAISAFNAAVGALRPGGPLSRQHHAGTALPAAGPLLGVRRGGAQRPRIGRVRLVRGP